MKKIFLLSLMIFFFASLFAQESSDYRASTVIKWAPASLALGKIGLGSEYNFKHKKSITFNFGFPSETNITRNIDNEDRTLKIKTLSVMAGYRMYLGKRHMTGFYFEPYVKYVDNKSSTITNFTIQTISKPFNMSTTYSGIGVGAQLGLQFMIAKRIVFDWYFLGPEANTSKFNLDAQEQGNGSAWDASAAADAQNEIENFINDIPLIKDKATVTVNAAARNVKAAYSGFLPGFRTGLSLGFRF